ncbi:MAG: lysoplasmalogenase [Chitinophagaceae bacterium]
MKQQWLLYLFVADLITEIIAIYYNLTNVRLFTKPLLMISNGLFIWQQVIVDKKIKLFLLFAIGFSLVGDIFLLFEKSNNSNFIFGLVSFLLAHIFYILLFLHARKSHLPKRRWNPFFITVILVYVAILFYILGPNLRALKIPVLIYSLILSFMLIAAYHSFNFITQTGGRWVITGAFFFVVSDSLLAINKFYTPLAFASIAIMITYAMAQLFIAIGITKFTRSPDKA